MDPTAESPSPAAPTHSAEPAAEPLAEPPAEPKKAESAPAPRTSKLPSSVQIEELFATVRRLESFAADEAKRVSGKLVPTVEEQAKKNIWVSLLLALGLGLILGIWLTGGRRRD